MSSTGISLKARRKARVFALQALYQHSFTGDALAAIETQYKIANQHHRVEWAYFSQLLHGVPEHLSTLNTLLESASALALKELTPIELIILRLAVFEWKYQHIPGPVVINEYLDIAHEYGTEEGYRFINGVLDKIIHVTMRDA